MNGADGASRWDVHIGDLPPHRWDEMPDERARRVVAWEHQVRPTLTTESIAWEGLGMTPRWVGDDSSGAVAAIQPGLFANRGAAEWFRFLAGAQTRHELALVISMLGGPEEPTMVGPGGPLASVSLPGSVGGSATVGGPRVVLATPPTPAEGLGPADRDLALRLADNRDGGLPWWPVRDARRAVPTGRAVGEDLHRGGQLVARVVSVPAASRVAASMSSSSWERKVRAHRCRERSERVGQLCEPCARSEAEAVALHAADRRHNRKPERQTNIGLGH